MEAISQEKSAGRPGRIGKGRASQSRGAGAAENAAIAQDASKPAVVVPAPIVEKMSVAVASRAVLEVVERLMRSENGDAKEILANASTRMQIKAINELARIYATESEYSRNGKALTLICCTAGIGWEMLDGWRERHWSTGEIRITESESEYVRSRIAIIKEEISGANGGIR